MTNPRSMIRERVTILKREKEKQTKGKTSVLYGNDVTKCKHVRQEDRGGEQLVVWEREPRKGLKYLRLKETECKWVTFSAEYPGMRTFRVVKREVSRIQMGGKISPLSTQTKTHA